MAEDQQTEHQQRNNVLWGILLILAGIWLGLAALGVEWARMEDLWPTFVVALGIVSLVSGLRRPRDEGSVWFGVMATLVGAFFFYITVGPAEWGDLRQLWPVFVLIGSVAWIIAWFVDVRKVPNLILALIAGAVGMLGLAYTFGRLEPTLADTLLSYWPVILILVGIGLLIQFLVQRE